MNSAVDVHIKCFRVEQELLSTHGVHQDAFRLYMIQGLDVYEHLLREIRSFFFDLDDIAVKDRHDAGDVRDYPTFLRLDVLGYE